MQVIGVEVLSFIQLVNMRTAWTVKRILHCFNPEKPNKVSYNKLFFLCNSYIVLVRVIRVRSFATSPPAYFSKLIYVKSECIVFHCGLRKHSKSGFSS